MMTPIFHERRRFKESNILFKSDNQEAIAAAIRVINFHRMELELYIARNIDFRKALHSYEVEKAAPRIIKLLAESTIPFDVGPMAAVAGVLADLAVEAMVDARAGIAIVENGGEISAISNEAFTVGLYAGKHILSSEFGFQIDPTDCPLGIATSSATVGHALSFGEADAVTVFAVTSGVADAAATAICNSVQGCDVKSSVEKGLKSAKNIQNLIRGVIIIRGKYVGSLGTLPRLVNIEHNSENSSFINGVSHF